jgi:hypothetical protein
LPLEGGNGGPPPSLVPLPRPQRESADGATPEGGPTIRIKLLVIPLGLAISCFAHLALLTPAAYFAGADPFNTAPADAITVDIVSPEEAGEAPKTGDDAKTESAKPEAAPSDATPSFGQSSSGARALDLQTAAAPSPTAPAEPPPRSQPPSPRTSRAIPQDAIGQTAAQAPPAPTPTWLPEQFAAALPEPAQTEESAVTNKFAMPLTLPDGKVGGKYDSQAVERAELSNDSIAAFRDRLKPCSLRPAGMAAGAKVVLRIYLKPDGSLATGLPQNPEPIKIEGASAGGGALYQSAVAAVRRCQPYDMLPPDRYQEWKSLDLTFTPQDF